jgi:glycosyltransferase involved in cell wall biosynthesis
MGLDNSSGEYIVFLGSDDDFYTKNFKKAMNLLNGEDLVYFNLKINDGSIWKVSNETKFLFCGSVKFMRRDFIGDTREDESMKSGEDYYFYQDLIKKNPTEKFLDFEVKHYNYPRYDSLSWLQRNREKQDRVSVIIPHYNMSRNLIILVKKLQKQVKSYPETEIIIIDDGSTENVQWLKTTGFRIFFQKNKGVSAARNLGLDKATGKYISFIDSDDDIEDDYLHTIYRTMRETKCDYAIYPFFAGKIISKNREELIGNYAVWSYSFTSDCIGDIRFNENMKYDEDREFLEKVITPQKKRYESDKAIYHYLWNSNQNSLSKRKLRGELD